MSTTALTETPIAEYQPTAAALADLGTKYRDVVYPVATTKGMADAKAARAELRGLRTRLEATRKEIKEPALRRCQQREAAERQQREEQLQQERAEHNRRERNSQAVHAIRERAIEFAGAPSSVIADEISRLELGPDVLAELDADFVQAGERAITDTIEKLRSLLETAQRREAEAEELRQQRDRQEQERRAEEERQAEERRQLAADRARLEAEALANVTLHDAAQTALDWFNTNGHGQIQPARMLESALSREVVCHD